jgi:hypothetical protein
VWETPEGAELLCIANESGDSFCSEYTLYWIIGCIMSLVGSLVSNLGLQVQKVAYNKHEALVTKELVKVCRIACPRVYLSCTSVS